MHSCTTGDIGKREKCSDLFKNSLLFDEYIRFSEKLKSQNFFHWKNQVRCLSLKSSTMHLTAETTVSHCFCTTRLLQNWIMLIVQIQAYIYIYMYSIYMNTSPKSKAHPLFLNSLKRRNNEIQCFKTIVSYYIFNIYYNKHYYGVFSAPADLEIKDLIKVILRS